MSMRRTRILAEIRRRRLARVNRFEDLKDHAVKVSLKAEREAVRVSKLPHRRKRCLKCDQIKGGKNYTIRYERGRPYLMGHCKECMCERVKKERSKTSAVRKYYAAYTASYYRKNRKFIQIQKKIWRKNAKAD